MSRTLSLIGAILLAGPAVAQPANEPPEIIVEGTKEYRDQVRQFVNSLTDAPAGGQISRFDQGVCPAAVGLPEKQNQAVAQRVRQVASAAGIPVAQGGCGPNALVIVVDDKQEFIDGLWKKYPQYFTDGSGRQIRPGKQAGPVAAWHIEGLLDSNGTVPGQELLWRYFITNSMDTSRLLPGAIPHLVAGIMVVEREALTGLTTMQLADYAAMRIFARTDPAKLKGSAPTILNVIDAPMNSAVPITLTEWDLAFLRALYSSNDRQFASQQRSDIQARLRGELNKLAGQK